VRLLSRREALVRSLKNISFRYKYLKYTRAFAQIARTLDGKGPQVPDGDHLEFEFEG